jgi:subtilisin family serine protease
MFFAMLTRMDRAVNPWRILSAASFMFVASTVQGQTILPLGGDQRHLSGALRHRDPLRALHAGRGDVLATHMAARGPAVGQLAARIVPRAALNDERPGFDPRHVLVRFKPSTQRSQRQAVHGAVGAEKVVKEYTLVDGLQLVEVPAGTVQQAISAYQSRPDVLYAEPDYIVYPTAVPNDPDFSLLWGLHNTGQTVNEDPGTAGADIRALQAWDVWTGGSNFRIAVVDTGVDYTHPDLAGNIWTNLLEVPDNGVDDDGNGYIDDVHGYNVASDSGDIMDTVGHGTHVSGTIGAVGNNAVGVVGVNWRCEIVGIKFLSPAGFISNAVEAMEYIIANDIRVSNHSWGGGGFSQALYDAIEASQQVGHIFVAAAGNGGANIDFHSFYPAGYNLPNIISVAALDNDDQLAWFSDFGVYTVDIGAPGVTTYSTVPGSKYGYKQGTSMATPHVAGVVALLMSRDPSLSWQQVRDRIFRSVRQVDSLEGRAATGGAVNAGAVLDCNVNGVFDGLDIGGGTSADCSGNGIPDECEPDCNSNGRIDSCETHNGLADDCNGNEIPDECEDCNGNGVADSCDIAAGTSDDCSGNGIPNECETDCNGNGVADDCDIVEYNVQDCNYNGVPDRCDVDDGTSVDCDGDHVPDECELDCNGNDVADDCDIADGTSEDCSDNHVPDECEPDCNTNGIADSCDILNETSADCSGNGVPDECESPDILYVDLTADGANDGSSWGDAFTDLQEAIDAASPAPGSSTQIWVAAGTYVPTHPTEDGVPRSAAFKLTDGVQLHGGFAGSEIGLCERNPVTNVTILSGDAEGNDVGDPVADDPSRSDNSYRVVLVPWHVDAVVMTGFTISGGYGDDPYALGKYDRGAGIRNQGELLLVDCSLTSNWAISLGGALYDEAGATVTDCTFRRNFADFAGGAVLVFFDLETVFANCEFSDNASAIGGAVYNVGLSVSFTDCIFINNDAASTGGGLDTTESSVTLVRCDFLENTARSNGAVSSSDGTIILNDCVFSGNVAQSYGGGLFLQRSYGMVSDCTFTGNQVTGPGAGGGAMANVSSTTSVRSCAFTNNMGGNGGAMYIHNGSDITLSDSVFSGNTAAFTGGAICNFQSAARLQNCTVAGGTAALYGGGFVNRYTGATASVVNSVFWGNEAPDGPQIYLEEPLSIAFSDVQGGQSGGVFTDGAPELLQWGLGNIEADPRFVDAAGSDLHLLPDSPCIDAGDNTAVVAGQADMDGHARIYDGDDVPPPVVDMGADEYAPDCNFNGVPDDQDIGEGTSEDIDGDGVPDECVACMVSSDCDDGDPCTFEPCTAGWCHVRPHPYGDVDHNGTSNLFDIFCLLDAIGGDFTTCSFEDSDIHPCDPDGVLNIFDVFAALAAIGGEDPCCGG